MAQSRVKTWVPGEVLTSVDQNAEFDNILNNALAVVSPWTGNMAAGGNDLTGIDELAFNDAAANASAARRLRANGANLTWHDGTAARQILESGTWTVDLGPSGSATRAVDTVYQNTSGRWRRVTVQMDVSDAANNWIMQVGSANPPTVGVARGGQSAALGGIVYWGVFTVVPNNWFYRLTQNAGTTTIEVWREMDE